MPVNNYALFACALKHDTVNLLLLRNCSLGIDDETKEREVDLILNQILHNNNNVPIGLIQWPSQDDIIIDEYNSSDILALYFPCEFSVGKWDCTNKIQTSLFMTHLDIISTILF